MEQPHFDPARPQLSPVNQFLSERLLPTIKKNRKLQFILIGLVVLIGLFYVVGAVMNNPEAMLQEFEEAARKGDANKLANLVISETDDLKVDAKGLEQFATFTKNNSTYLDKLMKTMHAQYYFETGEVEKIPLDAPIDYRMQGDFQVIKQEHALFYDTYNIVVRPYYVTIKTNEPDATIFVNDKQVSKTTSDKKDYVLGPVLPGYYMTKIEKPYPYGKLSNFQNIKALDQSKPNIESDIPLITSAVMVTSSIRNTVILINDKQIGNPFDFSETIGPFSIDGKVKIRGMYQFPWGEERSPEYSVNASSNRFDLTPIAFQSPESRTKITKMINEYFQSEVAAYTNKDKNKLVHLKKSTYFYKELTQVIDRLRDYNLSWRGKIVGTKIDYSKAEVKGNPQMGGYYVMIPVDAHYFSNDDDTLSDELSSTEPLQDNYKDYYATLFYNQTEKKWEIESMDRALFNDRESPDYMTGPDVVSTEIK